MIRVLVLLIFLAVPLSSFSQSSPGNINVNYSVDAFDKGKPWHYASIEYLNKFNFGAVIVRVNRSERFGKSGIQLEADAYPLLGKTSYAYLTTSVSWDSLFPKYKAAAEVYTSLGGGYEVSAGVRYIKPYGSNVVIGSASVNKYWSDFLLSFRPYLAFSESKAYPSVSGAFKWYFGAHSFAGITGSVGNTPDEPSANNLDNIYSLTSRSISLEVQNPLAGKLYVKSRAGLEHEEYTKDKFRDRFTAGIGFIYFFNL
jgi:YaiO family outer membrane protein